MQNFPKIKIWSHDYWFGKAYRTFHSQGRLRTSNFAESEFWRNCIPGAPEPQNPPKGYFAKCNKHQYFVPPIIGLAECINIGSPVARDQSGRNLESPASTKTQVPLKPLKMCCSRFQGLLLSPARSQALMMRSRSNASFFSRGRLAAVSCSSVILINDSAPLL